MIHKIIIRLCEMPKKGAFLPSARLSLVTHYSQLTVRRVFCHSYAKTTDNRFALCETRVVSSRKCFEIILNVTNVYYTLVQHIFRTPKMMA
jgi:hypothetical protein